MKNALLALALFAFVGTATAHEGKDEKKSKKSTAACCMKKDTKTAAVKATPAPTAAPVTKSL